MDTARRVEEVFSEAISIAPQDLPAFLQSRCAGDDCLISEVRSLLESHVEARSFLERPVGRVFTTSNGVPTIASPGQDQVGKRVGAFTLTSLLGQGGCGLVYLAHQERPVRRQVAVKILHPGVHSKEMLARFDLERQALVLMDHPNIATLFDAGETSDGLPYFAMEYVNGAPLTRHCDAERLGTDERLDLFVKVCLAVQHAHQRGIIHRDLKPGNILVAKTDQGHQPKVIDFGIAKLRDGPLGEHTLVTQAGTLIGTLDYMSPEQISGRLGAVDLRSDVYALGVILYELLTGRRPFELSHLSLAEAQRFVCEQSPPLASTTVSQQGSAGERRITYRDLRGDLDWIVNKAIDKDPERRYPSVSELAADVLRHQRDEPVEAGPPSTVYRIRKFVARNRVVSTAGIVVLLTLVSATSISLVSARRAWRAEAHSRATAEESQRSAYRTGILVAQSNFEKDPRVAKLALDAAPERLRDWEWHYLKARVDVAPAFFSSERNISSLAASDDGSHVALGMHDGEILLWSDGETQARHLTGHTLRVQSLDFSDDGQFLASGSSDGTIRLWSVASGISRVVGQHTQGVAAITIDRGGRRLASGGADGIAHVWSLNEGAPEVAQLKCSGPVYSVAFSGQDGETLAAATAKGHVQIWRLSGGSLEQEWQAASKGIRAMVALPEDNELITGSMDGSLIRWNASTGQQLLSFKRGQSPILSIALSNDRTAIAEGDDEGDTAVWDRLTGVRTAMLPGQGGFIQGVAFVDSNVGLITATWGGAARFWRIGPGQAMHQILLPADHATSISFGPDSRQVVASTYKGFVGRWDVQSGSQLVYAPVGTRGSAIDVGPTRLSRSSSKAVELVLGDSGAVEVSLESPDEVNVTVASLDGSILACGCETGDVRVWSVADRTVLMNHNGGSGCTAVAASRDNRFAAAGFRDGPAFVFDLNSKMHLPAGNWGTPITSIAFSLDCEYVAFGLVENSVATIHVLRTKDLSPVCSAGGTGFGVTALAFTASGQRIASGGNYRGVRLWSVLDGQELMTLRDLDGNACALDFSADGRSLAATTTTGSIYLFGRTPPRGRWSARPLDSQRVHQRH